MALNRLSATASILRRLIHSPRALSSSSAAAVAAADISPSHQSLAETEEDAIITMKGVRISGRPLYLDMQVTSPVDPRVSTPCSPSTSRALATPTPALTSTDGNPRKRSNRPVPRLPNSSVPIPRRSSLPLEPPNQITSPSRASCASTATRRGTLSPLRQSISACLIRAAPAAGGF
ncbi:hypothetical protein HPP92_019567 [Vanilla planifolia]|uniref:Uncharacterized protein n=1 Tax=Vanilla planifolia TaxID=51239 RepID=A0A835Q2J2_VANPL|nr:hypothetical protein HPP92_019567 [Vanilla planifolia]